MDYRVIQGDVLGQSGDVLICPANPQLNMSGGVNGEILRRGGEDIQRELRQFMRASGAVNLPPGTVVATGAGPLPFEQIIHAVSIDAFYDTDEEVVASTLISAWQLAARAGRTRVVMPALGTGYGRLPITEFACAFLKALAVCQELPIQLTLVLRDAESVCEIGAVTNSSI
jgi:O-acetyl-ADP-ribose deacetylase (regulator of RNase III)